MNVIKTTDELAEVCNRLGTSPFITVDTEFVREETYWPQLCLVQIAGPDEAVIVDPLAQGIELSPFYRLMADDSVVKVFHAGRQDIEIVFVGAGLIPTPIFDTQIAAMVCGFGESVSYGHLVKRLTGADVDKSSRFTDWRRRPLSDTQLTYALGDVTHLREIYRQLKSDIDSTGRGSWLAEEMAAMTDPATYEHAPENAWRRMKQRVKSKKAFSVLIELAVWRERMAQKQDVPRARILRDEALYDIANRMPTETRELGQLRTLSEGFGRSARAKEIVEAVRRGLERDPTTVPRLNTGNQLPADAVALVDLLKVLLKAAAARHRVAPRLIADSEDLERIAVEDEPDVAALRGWRRELFGDEALRLKRGEIALTTSGGEVVGIAVPGRV
ncbi:MAG: ribonuclease D [Hyphomicrobiaceae bacterium]